MSIRDRAFISLVIFSIINLLIIFPLQIEKIDCAVPVESYQTRGAGTVSNNLSVGLAGHRFSVYFDQSYEQVYSPLNTSFTGLSEFARFIMRQGGFVSINSKPLRDFLPTISKPGNVIVLGVAMLQRYSNEDIEAVRRFAEKGGGVLIFVEHDNAAGNAEFQNQIIEKYGVVADFSSNRTRLPSLSEFWTWVKVPEWEIERSQFFMPAPLKIEEEDSFQLIGEISEPADESKAIVVAGKKINEYVNFIVMGDAEMVWNGKPFMGIKTGDNQQLMEKAVVSLAGVDYSDEPLLPESRVDRKILSRGEDRVLFVRDGYSLVPREEDCPLFELTARLTKKNYLIDVAYVDEISIEDYSLVFVFNPLVEIDNSSLEKLKKARRMVVLVDGQTDFFEAEPRALKAIEDVIGRAFSHSTKIPGNSLIYGEGMQFNSSTLVGSGEENNFLFTTGFFTESNKTVTLNRATTIEIQEGLKEPDEIKIVMRSDSKASWRMKSLTPLIEAGEPLNHFAPPEDLKSREAGYPVVVKTDRIIAMADVNLLFNSTARTAAGPELIRMIID